MAELRVRWKARRIEESKMGPVPAIRVAGLDNKYLDVHAVKGIDFTVRSGEIFSLLGPNSPWKSTTISMLCCLLKPTSGDARVMDFSVTKQAMEVKKRIGVVPQEIALYPDLNAVENLRFWGKLHGLSGQELQNRIETVLTIIGLTDRQKQRVQNYSGGMQRRLNIGVALLHDPNILIMDEPTVGIDPQSRRHILENVKELNTQGKTILYTTHSMEEAQELSHHIAIMDQGNIVAYGTLTELVRFIGEQDRIDIEISTNPETVKAEWRKLHGVHTVSRNNHTITILTEDSNAVLPSLFNSRKSNRGSIGRNRENWEIPA